MFASVRLGNFKCYKKSGEIPLRPITLLVGPNNAGKSTILQALLLLKQTVEDRSTQAALVTSGQFVDMGAFQDIVRGRPESGGKFSIGITLDEPARSIVEIRRPGDKGVTRVPLGSQFDITFGFDRKANQIKVANCKLSREGNVLIEVSRNGQAWKSSLVPDRFSQRFKLEFSHFFPALRPIFHEKKVNPKQIEKHFGTMMMLDLQEHSWSHIFRRVHHIAPLRTRVPWYTAAGKRASSELGPGGENLLRVLGSRETVADTGKTLLDLVDQWISKRFEMLSKLRLQKVDPAGTVRSLIGDERDGFGGINIAAMGEGVSQLLPIVARSLMTMVGECLLIEQPEIHLHPVAQADLADLFIDDFKKRKHRQYIIETHSEHLVLRIRRRVAEGIITPDDVAVLFVEKQKQETKVRHLKLNGKGHFDEWPKGFFEEAYQEALAIAMASGSQGPKN